MDAVGDVGCHLGSYFETCWWVRVEELCQMGGLGKGICEEGSYRG